MSRQVANLRLGKIQSLIRRRGLTAVEFAKVDIREAVLRISFHTLHSTPGPGGPAETCWNLLKLIRNLKHDQSNFSLPNEKKVILTLTIVQ